MVQAGHAAGLRGFLLELKHAEKSFGLDKMPTAQRPSQCLERRRQLHSAAPQHLCKCNEVPASRRTDAKRYLN